MIKGKKYEIHWLDTFSLLEWWDDEELEEKVKNMNYLQTSVGFFAGEYYGWIILCTHQNPNQDFKRWGHPDFIPKGCIKEIKSL